MSTMTVAEAMLYLARRQQPHGMMPVAYAIPWHLPEREHERPHLEPHSIPSVDLSVGLPVHGVVTSRFGRRRHPILGAIRQHQGVDISAPAGSPVWATADGIVESARQHVGYGLTIILDHGNGRETVYGHLSALYVHPGDRITRGQIIGAVGSTGIATGPHVHYEVRRGGHAVNPGVA